jgi:hypothetical protein
MKIKFEQQREFVYASNFELPCDADTLTEELHNQNWRPQTDYFTNRYCSTGVGTNIQLCLEFFRSDTIKQLIIDTLYADNKFVNAWKMTSAEQMFKSTDAFANLFLDKPGFKTDMHLDARSIVATGMCYFIEQDDADQSTFFYTFSEKNSALRIPTGMGKGWMIANMHSTWHRGHNISDQNRYSILYGLQLKI